MRVSRSGILFANENTMKSLQDRIWLVLLGVAVAVLVLLTTVFWSEPSARSGSDAGNGKTTAQRTLIPKISTQVLKALGPSKEAKK